jgi:ABC-type Fe3+/spermidine/putrescine transport system ATPase subunit
VSSASLELVGLTRRFGKQVAVDDVSLSVAEGELVALVGASGSGKTTTLRIAAGYEAPDAGRVLLDGREITNLAPQHRGFGMVFQHYALFPHMSVQDNIAFGLEARGQKKAERRKRALAALQTVGLAHAAERPVQSLSGGEQQRVALARAVVIEPRVVLLDEPLSNLDPTLRRSMRDELRWMLRKLNVTALLVTHDQEDAFAVADRVAIMQSGRLLQVGRPEDLYQRPASRDVASFIGHAALLPASFADGRLSVTVEGKSLVGVVAVGNGAATGSKSWLAVLRPESVSIAIPGGLAEGWVGRVESSRFAGAQFVYRVSLAGGAGEIEAASPRMIAGEGDEVVVSLSNRPNAVVPA